MRMCWFLNVHDGCIPNNEHSSLWHGEVDGYCSMVLKTYPLGDVLSEMFKAGSCNRIVVITVQYLLNKHLSLSQSTTVFTELYS